MARGGWLVRHLQRATPTPTPMQTPTPTPSRDPPPVPKRRLTRSDTAQQAHTSIYLPPLPSQPTTQTTEQSPPPPPPPKHKKNLKTSFSDNIICPKSSSPHRRLNASSSSSFASNIAMANYSFKSKTSPPPTRKTSSPLPSPSPLPTSPSLPTSLSMPSSPPSGLRARLIQGP